MNALASYGSDESDHESRTRRAAKRRAVDDKGEGSSTGKRHSDHRRSFVERANLEGGRKSRRCSSSLASGRHDPDAANESSSSLQHVGSSASSISKPILDSTVYSVHPDHPFSEAELQEIQDESTRSLIPFLLPPPRKLPDGTSDRIWGLRSLQSKDEEGEKTGCDPALEAKLSRFHDLKAQGIHFNESLMSNRSFNNPHIYSTLVDFLGIDETMSNIPDICGPDVWDPYDPEILHDGDAHRITQIQEREQEEREKRQRSEKKREIGFVRSSANTSRDLDEDPPWSRATSASGDGSGFREKDGFVDQSRDATSARRSNSKSQSRPHNRESKRHHGDDHTEKKRGHR